MSVSFPPRRARLSSPPVFLTYETIAHHHSYSRSPSPGSDSEDESDESDSEIHNENEGAHIMGNMDLDVQPPSHKVEISEEEDEDTKEELRRKRAEKRKGKQPEQSPAQKAEAKARRRAKRAQEAEEAYRNAYRPILTIKSSQGFVWNQVCLTALGAPLQWNLQPTKELFVPAWQKDRYLCSTSPDATDMSPVPGSMTSGMDFEVECVEIRIREGELDGLIPR
ncbi:hypothetical protein BS47DRAFT_1396548 [Hydnum rufescens UP504]|uniref:Uncharacterized protein n=1 Tax=Hydnum rufescens UP504 TaxID=1448309 RepID=A0A9P6DTQ3_9AGAM|nr:hypothetical protein BS47DRAFT_1396548 [Hydnum rufescens UP504]